MNSVELIAQAKEALKYSYSPYSGFKVGAALLTRDGRVFRGCNIENSSYSATVCAERTALFKAVSEGADDFEAIAVVSTENGCVGDYCAPCGVCLQVFSEFCTDGFKIYITNKDNEIKEFKLSELLPQRFEFDR